MSFCKPSFQGHVESSADATAVFEAAKAGECPLVSRRFDLQVILYHDSMTFCLSNPLNAKASVSYVVTAHLYAASSPDACPFQQDVICPGFGYVYDEADSVIRRWTDGLSWYVATYCHGTRLTRSRGDSYHPGSGFMIYHEVHLVMTEGGKRFKREKDNGLRKRAVADPTSSLRLVYYYYDRYRKRQ